MNATDGSHLHADFSAPEYQASLDKMVSHVANITGAQIINLADGSVLTAGECDAMLAAGAAILFGKQPADCKSPMRYLPTAINEFVIRVNDEFAISCGSPGNRQFFFVVESAKAGLGVAINALETLIGEGPDALKRKGGHGIIIERDKSNHIGIRDEHELTAATADRPASAEAVNNLYGLSEDGTAGAALQHFVDAGALLKQYQAAGIDGSYGFLRVPFAPDHLVVLQCKGQCPPLEMEKLLRRLSNDVLRQIIHSILDDPEFNSDTDLPENDAAFNKIIDELRALPEDDLKNRLSIGGFANHSLGERGEMDDGAMVLRCRECIYFLPHQRWCDLPELPLPVEADWYCKLWKL